MSGWRRTAPQPAPQTAPTGTGGEPQPARSARPQPRPGRRPGSSSWPRVGATAVAAVAASIAALLGGSVPSGGPAAAAPAAPAAGELTPLAPAGLHCEGLIDLLASRPGPDYEFRGWDYRWEIFNQESVISQPFGVALDRACNVYVGNYAPTGGEVVKLSPEGATLATWGGPGKGAGQFERLEGVAVDLTGKIYAADSANGRVQRFAAPGAVDRLWASQFGCARVAATVPCQLVPQDATFNGNFAVGVDGLGSLYVVDGSYGIKKFAPSGELAARWGSVRSGEPGGFRQADGIALDAQGNLYVADTLNYRVQKFSPEGAPLAQWGAKDTGPLRLNQPAGVAVDGAGMVYIADTDNHRVVALSPEGQVVRQWGLCAREDAAGTCTSGRLGSQPGQFAQPHHLVANARGELFVADRANNRVQVLKAYPLWERVPPPTLDTLAESQVPTAPTEAPPAG